jgi:hypothetical protein
MTVYIEKAGIGNLFTTPHLLSPLLAFPTLFRAGKEKVSRDSRCCNGLMFQDTV